MTRFLNLCLDQFYGSNIFGSVEACGGAAMLWNVCDSWTNCVTYPRKQVFSNTALTSSDFIVFQFEFLFLLLTLSVSCSVFWMCHFLCVSFLAQPRNLFLYVLFYIFYIPSSVINLCSCFSSEWFYMQGHHFFYCTLLIWLKHILVNFIYRHVDVCYMWGRE